MAFNAANMNTISFDSLAMNLHASSDLEEIPLSLNIGDVPFDKEAKAAVYGYLLKNNTFVLSTTTKNIPTSAHSLTALKIFELHSTALEAWENTLFTFI